MTSSRILFYSCLSFLGGIFLSYLVKIPLLGSFLLFFLSLILFFSFSSRSKFSYFFIFLALFSLGLLRYEILEENLSKSLLLEKNDSGEEVVILGKVISEPIEKERNEKFIVKAFSLKGPSQEEKKVEGKIIVYSSRKADLQYGDVLELKGFLESPPVFQEFDYKNYLLKNKIYSIMRYPEISILRKEKSFYSPFVLLKKRSRKIIYENIPPPQSLILAAIILGDKERLSEKIKNDLNRVGIRHIVAISGMHIVILSSILMTVLLSLGLWRWQAFLVTIVFLFLFIILTGLQPSGTRAVIMGTILLLSQILGRPYAGLRTLVFVAFLMVLFNPFLLFYDVGFQLSFLATAGIILLSSFLKKHLKFIPEKSFLNLRSIISMTLAAQIFTLPILLYNFGYFSLISPLTNILVVPIVPLLMSLGFLFLFLSFFIPPLGKIISWFCWIFLTYIVKLVEFFSKIPFTVAQVKISWIWALFLYLIIGLGTVYLKKKEKLYFLRGYGG